MTQIPKDLRGYIPFVDFLGKTLGPNYEVFLYDLKGPEHPIIAIANGHLSGRKVGFLMKDVMIKMLKKEKENKEDDEDYLIRHDAIGRDGRRFKSSTILIRNDFGEPIGALCVNFNLEPMIAAQEFFESIGAETTNLRNLDINKVIFAGEVFSDGNAGTLESIYEHFMDKNPDIQLSRPQDRQTIVSSMYKDGFFQLRGAVSFCAEKFEISEPSVYRYIARAKNENDEPEIEE
jgi:predicted transcriptional regulator YheO